MGGIWSVFCERSVDFFILIYSILRNRSVRQWRTTEIQVLQPLSGHTQA